MMFDPPDYPYKELSETYDDLLLNKNTTDTATSSVEDTILETSNRVSFQSNDSGRYFNVDSSFLDNNSKDELSANKEEYVVQSENLLNYEPTLLDEITVSQFLLPLQDSALNNDKGEDNSGPDLLALHSCVICHDIFTTESDLLDHTIAFHASMNILESDNANDKRFEQVDTQTAEMGANNNTSGFETDWLVCSTCERVLSTALEVEPKEQLCCVNMSGKCSVSTRLLHTMFVCDLCSGLFADGEALDKHRMSCYVEDNNLYEETTTLNSTDATYFPEVCFSCDICGKQCSSTEQLKAHLLECQKPARSGRRTRAYTAVNNNKMWNCGSCNQLFATARELYRHKRGEDRPEGAPLTAYVCEECDKVLGSMCALHTHKKMHKVLKPGYPCRICSRRFNQSGHLAIHMRMHTGERPYPCDLCPKAFKVKVERDDHRRTHTGERPFACAACPKTFTAAARLREHARIHTDQRPYRCDICGAAFRRPYARTVHTLIHTGEKPHECDVCGTAFRRSGDMWKHKRTLHGV